MSVFISKEMGNKLFKSSDKPPSELDFELDSSEGEESSPLEGKTKEELAKIKKHILKEKERLRKHAKRVEFKKNQESEVQDHKLYMERNERSEEAWKIFIQEEEDSVEKYLDPYVLGKIKGLLEGASRHLEVKDVFECVVCLEDRDKTSLAPLPCGHELCVFCYEILNPKICPLCRRPASLLFFSTHYMLFCLGEKTSKNLFENGGLLTVKLLFLPDFKDQSQTYFREVKYYEHNLERRRLIDSLLEASLAGYVLVLQESKQAKQWFRSVELWELLAQLKTLDF